MEWIAQAISTQPPAEAMTIRTTTSFGISPAMLTLTLSEKIDGTRTEDLLGE
jgi:hypothetical protein